MKSIDIRSLLIGILGTALVMVLLGATTYNPQGNLEFECVKYSYPQDYQAFCIQYDTSGKKTIDLENGKGAWRSIVCNRNGCRTDM